MSTDDKTIDAIWERSGHGTRREDIEAAFNAGQDAERQRIRQRLIELGAQHWDAQAACYVDSWESVERVP